MDKGARPIGLETDSVLLKKGVNNDECGLSALYLGLEEEIKEYLKQNFEVCRFTSPKRNCNKAGHCFASYGCTLSMYDHLQTDHVIPLVSDLVATLL